MIKIIQFPCLKDNYGFILYNDASQNAVCIDTPDANEIIKHAKENGLKISQVWNTHWHKDHAGGNLDIKNEFNAQIIGPKEVETHGFPLDKVLKTGDVFDFEGIKIEIIDLSGHTMGQIGYLIEQENILFVGDALFVLGCGRLFEGDAKLAYENLARLKKLSPQTKIYCAHEYSLANAQFCNSLNLSNNLLHKRIDEIKQMRDKNLPTVPTSLEIEFATNPFLLADYESLKKELNINFKEDYEVFAHIRELKNKF